jgi:hypothetical protein
MSQGVANALYGGQAVNPNRKKQEAQAIIAKEKSSVWQEKPVAKDKALMAQKVSGDINVAMPGVGSANVVLSGPQVNVSKYLGVLTMPNL